MPIDEKLHAVPHLKALINGIDTSSGQREGNLHMYKDRALGENLISVHKTRVVRIIICRSVSLPSGHSFIATLYSLLN